jgi:hypothetical protein
MSVAGSLMGVNETLKRYALGVEGDDAVVQGGIS